MNRPTVRYKTDRLSPVDPLQALESLVESGQAERYWIYGSDIETRIAIDAVGEVVVADEHVQSTWNGRLISEEIATDPFEQIRRQLNEMPLRDWRAFGHIAFDAAGYYYPYPFRAPSPQVSFVIPRTELIITAEATTIRSLEDPELIASSIKDAKLRPHNNPNAPPPDFSDREAYEQQVIELLRDIHAGKLTKAILARCVELPGSIDIFSTFDAIRRLNAVNAAKRTYCFQQPDLSGVGSSPELLMKTRTDGSIFTVPLAGTYRRGRTLERDEALRTLLLNDPKEIREHRISVAQVQQEELKRVCVGEINEEPMEVLSLPTVQHLATTLSGKLAVGKTLWDGLRELFPGVTVSGIDKRTAIETIAAFEKRARGPYAGAIGWVASNGESDLAIAIRSAFEDVDGVTLRAGAGIIAESIPKREYKETTYKMRAIWEQLVLK